MIVAYTQCTWYLQRSALISSIKNITCLYDSPLTGPFFNYNVANINKTDTEIAEIYKTIFSAVKGCLSAIEGILTITEHTGLLNRVLNCIFKIIVMKIEPSVIKTEISMACIFYYVLLKIYFTFPSVVHRKKLMLLSQKV